MQQREEEREGMGSRRQECSERRKGGREGERGKTVKWRKEGEIEDRDGGREGRKREKEAERAQEERRKKKGSE